jgi:hypothetical protein
LTDSTFWLTPPSQPFGQKLIILQVYFYTLSVGKLSVDQMVFDQNERSQFEQAALTHGMNKRTNITTDILAEGSVDA